MKHLLKILAMVIFLPIAGHAADASFVKAGGGNNTIIGNLANEAGLAYNRSYFLPAGVYGAKSISSVVTYSSVTYANVVFSTANITLATGMIGATAHGFTNALAVLLTQTAGTVPVPLVNQTTYYAMYINANQIKLATTSAQAVSIDPIIFISSTVTGTQTYTLSALAITGTPSFKWQASNGGTDVFDIDITSVTISEYTAGGATVGYDFDDFNYTTLILNVVAPTAGGLNIVAETQIKQ